MNVGKLLARLPIAFLIKWCAILAALVAGFVLVQAILDPFFVYYQLPRGIKFLAVACAIAIPWAVWEGLTNPNIYKRWHSSKDTKEGEAEVVEQSKKKYWIALGCAVVVIYLIVYESNQFDQTNQAAHYRNVAITAMENDCAQSCALYGIEQSNLVGPHLEHVVLSEPHSGKRDYLFSWHSIKPKVTLTEHVYNYDGRKWFDLEVIDATWTGKQLPPAPVVDQADDLAPHYTALRPDFRKMIRSSMPEIKNAFMRAKLADPDMSGDVKVHIIVDTYGQVSAASIVDSDLDNADFENNLVYILKGLTFKSGQYATFDIVYTFSFD